MISQTTLYSDCINRHADCRVEAVTMSLQSTWAFVAMHGLSLDSHSYSRLSAQLPLESTCCIHSGPASRLISKPNPRQVSCFSYSRQRLRIFAKDMNGLAVRKIKLEGWKTQRPTPRKAIPAPF